MLSFTCGGDSLVVTKLDRLGRSVRNLKQSPTNCSNVGWAFERCPRASIRPHGREVVLPYARRDRRVRARPDCERTHDGLAAARARGRKGAQSFKMTPTKIRQARAMYDEGAHTVQEIADNLRGIPAHDLPAPGRSRRAGLTRDHGAPQRPAESRACAPTPRRCAVDADRGALRRHGANLATMGRSHRCGAARKPPRRDKGASRIPTELVTAIERWPCAGRLPPLRTSIGASAISRAIEVCQLPGTRPFAKSCTLSTRA